MSIQRSAFSIQRLTPTRLGWLGLAFICGVGIAVLPAASVPWVLGGLAGLAVSIAILAEPTIGIALTILAGPLGPLEREVLHLLPLDSAQLLLAFTVFAYLLKHLHHRQNSQTQPSSPPFPLSLLTFLCVVTLTFFQIRDFGDWAAEVLKWVELLWLCLVVGREHKQRKLTLIIGVVLFSAAFQGALGLWQYFRGYGPVVFLVPGTNYYRSYGTFQQPNPFGGYVGLIWPFCLGVVLHRIWRLKTNGQSSIVNRQFLISLVWITLALIATGLALSGVFTSGSRGAVLSAGVALVVMGLATLRKPVLWLGLGLAGFITLAAITFNQVPAALTNTISGLVDDYGAIDVRGVYLTPVNFSNVERLAHWQVAFAMMRDHPWLGVGFGNYGAYYEQYRLLYWVNALGHAHNYYLNIFAETGVIGLGTYLLMWVIIFAVTLAAIRHISTSDLSTSSLQSVFLNSQFSILNSKFLYIGLLGTWAHLTVHQLFDNLYVANSFLLIGVLLGVLINRGSRRSILAR